SEAFLLVKVVSIQSLIFKDGAVTIDDCPLSAFRCVIRTTTSLAWRRLRRGRARPAATSICLPVSLPDESAARHGQAFAPHGCAAVSVCLACWWNDWAQDTDAHKERP